MGKVRKLGTTMIVLGLVLVGTSLYIQSQVVEGQQKIDRAQESMDQGNTLFSLTPPTKRIGQELSGSMQKKIDEGTEKVHFYEGIAHGLLVGGIVCVIIGIGSFFIRKKR